MVRVQPSSVVFEPTGILGVERIGDDRHGLAALDTSNALATHPLARIVRRRRRPNSARQRLGIGWKQCGQCEAQWLKNGCALCGHRIGRVPRGFAHQMAAAQDSFLDPDPPENTHLPMTQDVRRAVRQDLYYASRYSPAGERVLPPSAAALAGVSRTTPAIACRQPASAGT